MTPSIPCQYCGRRIVTYRDPEPDDEIICMRCDEAREDARRDDWHDAQEGGELEA